MFMNVFFDLSVPLICCDLSKIVQKKAPANFQYLGLSQRVYFIRPVHITRGQCTNLPHICSGVACSPRGNFFLNNVT